MRLRHALPAATLFVAACGPTYSSGGSSTPTPAPTPSAVMGDMSGMNHWSANLAAINGSTVHGTAMIHSVDGGQQSVQIQVSGGASGATYPWHIHTGTCADGMTQIVGNPQSYTALGSSGDGTAALMTTIPVTLSDNQRYHVNVHAPGGTSVVACGDLAR